MIYVKCLYRYIYKSRQLFVQYILLCACNVLYSIEYNSVNPVISVEGGA